MSLVLMCIAFALMAAHACNPSGKSGGNDAKSQQLKPWQYSLDSNYVLKNPDKFAWELFRAVNWPADTVTFMPDTTRKFGDSGWVVWQTWKTGKEVYHKHGNRPSPWNIKRFHIRNDTDFSRFSIKARLKDIRVNPTFGIEEVVMNKSTFSYILENQLYNIDGQLKFYNSGAAMRFPDESIEIKVKWKRIPNTGISKARYHWQYIYITEDGKVKKELYGMVSMHITSRVLTRWFWATFEHIDNRAQTHPGDDGWQLTSRDKFSCDQPPYDCELAPRNFGLEGTKWQHYRLRGTQTDYTEPNGKPVLLANSNIERGFQMTSSCMTCHSLATMGPLDSSGNMQRVNFTPSLIMVDGVMFGGVGYIGKPDQNLYNLPGGGKMRQTDFVWSLIEANPITPKKTSGNK